MNCGSSSIKYQLFEMSDGSVLATGLVEQIGEPGFDQNLLQLTPLRTEQNILTDAEMWKESQVLREVGDMPLFRRHGRHIIAVKPDSAAIRSD